MNATSYPYDLTNISMVNSTTDFITQVNHLTGDTLMLGILVVTLVVTFMALLGYGAREAIVVSLFINSIAASVFLVLGWISITYLILFVVAFALSLAFLFGSER
jgi:hypothetical protein